MSLFSGKCEARYKTGNKKGEVCGRPTNLYCNRYLCRIHKDKSKSSSSSLNPNGKTVNAFKGKMWSKQEFIGRVQRGGEFLQCAKDGGFATDVALNAAIVVFSEEFDIWCKDNNVKDPREVTNYAKLMLTNERMRNFRGP